MWKLASANVDIILRSRGERSRSPSLTSEARSTA